MNQTGHGGKRSHQFLQHLIAAIVGVLMAIGALAGANSVQADSVWHQSYQRDSASEACVGQAGETPWQDSWGTNPGWSPSWEQWANNGQGGWVCSRSITWARDSAARVYNIGDIGPGGGLVFYIDSASGLRYEMAPKNWNDPTNPTGVDPTNAWITNVAKCYASGSITDNQNCQANNLYPETTSGAQTASMAAATAIGMGSANTDAIIARMAAGSVSSSDYAAGLASAYAGGDGLTTGWFLPSKDELNAMCNYSRNPTTPPTGTCTGDQNLAFAAGTYGFTSLYWSSSQFAASLAWTQGLGNGNQFDGSKANPLWVRPVRSF